MTKIPPDNEQEAKKNWW